MIEEAKAALFAIQQSGPTIAEVKAAGTESLWQFLLQLPLTLEAQIFYALSLSGMIGMVINYVNLWAREEIEGSLRCYLFHASSRRTLLAFFAFMGLAITAISTNTFVTEAGVFVGWKTVLWFGVLNGFAADAIANKGRRPEWSPIKRAAKQEAEAAQPTQPTDKTR